MSVRIPPLTLVLVADGRKALVLSNEGDAALPDLRVKQTIQAPPNPRTSSQGADRPGRAIVAGRRSAVEQTDWHQAAEDKFAATVVELLLADELPKALILVAPPKFLAQLRKRLPEQARSRVIAEIAKDLTHLTVREIEQSLASK
jgi:protein required for attachment to host cells